MKKNLLLIAFVCAFSTNSFSQPCSFNTDSTDAPLIQVSNYTWYPGCGTCWSQYVVANPGDILAVLIYYHNNGPFSSYSTDIWIDYPWYDVNTFDVMYAGLESSYAQASIYDYIDIELSSPATIEYIPNSIEWYPNGVYHPFVNAQTGDEIFSLDGLALNSIQNGDDGFILLYFEVGQASTTDVISEIATKLPKLTVYPTIAQREVTVASPFDGTGTLYDMTGKEVLSVPFSKDVPTKFQVENLPRGMYLMRGTDGKAVSESERIILN